MRDFHSKLSLLSSTAVLQINLSVTLSLSAWQIHHRVVPSVSKANDYFDRSVRHVDDFPRYFCAFVSNLREATARVKGEANILHSSERENGENAN